MPRNSLTHQLISFLAMQERKIRDPFRPLILFQDVLTENSMPQNVVHYMGLNATEKFGEMSLTWL